jgi:hypothetical protein
MQPLHPTCTQEPSRPDRRAIRPSATPRLCSRERRASHKALRYPGRVRWASVRCSDESLGENEPARQTATFTNNLRGSCTEKYRPSALVRPRDEGPSQQHADRVRRGRVSAEGVAVGPPGACRRVSGALAPETRPQNGCRDLSGGRTLRPGSDSRRREPLHGVPRRG